MNTSRTLNTNLMNLNLNRLHSVPTRDTLLPDFSGLPEVADIHETEDRDCDGPDTEPDVAAHIDDDADDFGDDDEFAEDTYGDESLDETPGLYYHSPEDRYADDELDAFDAMLDGYPRW